MAFFTSPNRREAQRPADGSRGSVVPTPGAPDRSKDRRPTVVRPAAEGGNGVTIVTGADGAAVATPAVASPAATTPAAGESPISNAVMKARRFSSPGVALET